MRHPLSSNGHTLLEVMVSLVLFGFLSMSLIAMNTMEQRMHKEDRVRTELMNHARFVMDRVIWGTASEDGSDAIAEATDFDIQPNQFRYTLPDGDERRINYVQDELQFQKQGNNVTIYDPNGDLPPEPQNYSTELEFEEVLPNVLEIRLVLGKRQSGRWYYASLTTHVSLRN